MTHSLQHAVTYFSSYHIAVSRSKAFTQKKQWCDMNTPHSFQGSIPADAEMENIYLRSSSALLHRHTVFNPPPEISNMMTSTTHWMRANEDQMKNKKFGAFLEDAGECVVTRKHYADMVLRRTKVPKFFSADEALAAMRVNLIPADNNSSVQILNRHVNQFKSFANSLEKAEPQEAKINRHRMKTLIKAFDAMHENLIRDSNENLISDSNDSSCNVLNRHCEVPIMDLIDQFRETLSLFYPDGIEMTAEEKEESCEMLTEWKDTQFLRIATEVVGGAVIETQMLDFLLFEDWFTNVFVVTVSQTKDERLLTHTLRYIPHVKRRVGRPQMEMQHSSLHIGTAKAFSLVAPSDTRKRITLQDMEWTMY
jgi:hypothetical protein